MRNAFSGVAWVLLTTTSAVSTEPEPYHMQSAKRVGAAIVRTGAECPPLGFENPLTRTPIVLCVRVVENQTILRMEMQMPVQQTTRRCRVWYSFTLENGRLTFESECPRAQITAPGMGTEMLFFHTIIGQIDASLAADGK